MGAAQSLEGVPSERASLESVVMEDEMFVWGGGTSLDGPYHSRRDLFGVNMLTGKWSCYQASPLQTPTPCCAAAATCIGNTIYSHGGMINWSPFRASDELYKLTINKEMKWIKMEIRGTKPTARGAAAMCSVDGKLLLMGGYGPLPSENKHPEADYAENTRDKGNGWNNELFEFNPQTGCWSPVCVTGSKPSPREGHTLTAIDEKRAVLFGGYDGNKCLNELWLFDVERKVWSQITLSSPLPQPRLHHTVCTMVCTNEEIKVLLLGGCDDQKQVVSDCWMLDVLRGGGEKLKFDGEAFGRLGHSAGCVMLSDGTIVISAFGGFKDFSSSSVVSNPLFYQWKPSLGTVLCSGRPPVEPLLRACLPSVTGQTSKEMRQLSEEVQRLTARYEQLQSQLAHTEQQKDEQLAQKDKQLTQKDEQLAQKNEQLTQKDKQLAQLAQKDEQLAQKDQRLAHKDEQLAQKDEQLIRKDKQFTQKDEQLTQKDEQLAQKDKQLTQERQEKQRLADANQSLTARVEQLRVEHGVKDAQLREERARLDKVDRTRAAAEANCQLVVEAQAAVKGNNQRLERQLENLRGSRDSLQQQLDMFLTMFAIPLDEVKIDVRRKRLGGGSYGEVRLALWKGVAVAVKQFHQVLMKGHTRRLCEQELSVCCSIRHSNIVLVHGFAILEDRPLHIVMELLEGSLEDLIAAARKSGRYLSEREQVDVAMGTVSGINYLHGLRPRPYIYGDVKMVNVMVTRDMTAKVGDLEASHVLDSSLSAGPLSPNYMAPERVAQGQAHSTLASDVFSLGVTLCEIFTGEAAVQARHHDQLDAIVDADLKDMCLQMCSMRADERPTAGQVVATLSEKQKASGYKASPPRRKVVGKSESDDVRLFDRV